MARATGRGQKSQKQKNRKANKLKKLLRVGAEIQNRTPADSIGAGHSLTLPVVTSL
jgi:hypothetical protein